MCLTTVKIYLSLLQVIFTNGFDFMTFAPSVALIGHLYLMSSVSFLAQMSTEVQTFLFFQIKNSPVIFLYFFIAAAAAAAVVLNLVRLSSLQSVKAGVSYCDHLAQTGAAN